MEEKKIESVAKAMSERTRLVTRKSIEPEQIVEIPNNFEPYEVERGIRPVEVYAALLDGVVVVAKVYKSGSINIYFA